MSEGKPAVRRFLEADSFDDLLRDAIVEVSAHGETVSPGRGPNRELRGMTLELANPRARLSRSESRGRAFSPLGELLWYLSGSDRTDHIAYYISQYGESDEGGRIHGAYGPRIRGAGSDDQLTRVVKHLTTRRDSRRAVVQIFDRADIVDDHKDVPCTCTLQFFVRDNHLDLVTYMRSNDVYIGLPHDVFCFTMIQEMVAASVGVRLGRYIHMAGSLHLYDVNAGAAEAFLAEGYFSPNPMPAMPTADPFSQMRQLVEVERRLRTENELIQVDDHLAPYWLDLARLLLIFKLAERKDASGIQEVRRAMSSSVYDVHIVDLIDRKGLTL